MTILERFRALAEEADSIFGSKLEYDDKVSMILSDAITGEMERLGIPMDFDYTYHDRRLEHYCSFIDSKMEELEAALGDGEEVDDEHI